MHRRPLAGLALATCLLAGAWPGSAPAAPAAATTVVVMKDAAATQLPEQAVHRLGGHVERRLPLIRGFAARVPASAVAALARVDGVRSVTEDRRLDARQDAAAPVQPGASLDGVRRATGADTLDATGRGVDIALVDTGVAPVAGLDAPGKVVDGADFSAQSGDRDLRHLDAFGHGTHLAGIVAGEDREAGFEGIAPDARIVNVKVGAADGSTSLVRLLAGIDWSVRNRDRGDRNIRVLALAFGAPALGSYRNDPLAYAVEQAWKRDVVVVAAAGNGGAETGRLDSPAYDPYVLAVGAEDSAGTHGVADDFVPGWSSFGDEERNPDVVAPGVAITSLRVPGSYLDEQFPQGRIGERFFRGSGTSQATAVTAASVALLLERRPDLSPDQVKALLTGSATPVPGVTAAQQGAGLFDLAAAAAAHTPAAVQRHPRATIGGVWRGARDIGPGLTADPSMSRWSMSRWSMSRWSMSRWSMSRWSMSRWSMSRWSGSGWSTLNG
jgi:serine protease AprX